MTNAKMNVVEVLWIILLYELNSIVIIYTLLPQLEFILYLIYQNTIYDYCSKGSSVDYRAFGMKIVLLIHDIIVDWPSVTRFIITLFLRDCFSYLAIHFVMIDDILFLGGA